MASGALEQSPNHRILKSKEKTGKKNPIFEIIGQRRVYTLSLTLNDIYYMPKLTSKENSDGQLFYNKIILNRIIHLIEEVLMTFLLKIVPWIQNGMSG